MSYNLKYCSFIRIILMRLPCFDYKVFFYWGMAQ